jgi:hypothetical protein
MRVNKKDLENMVKRLNSNAGFKEVNYNTVGSFKLYHDANGYAVHKVTNEHGGVESIGNMYGLTCKECYIFLSGLLVDL